MLSSSLGEMNIHHQRLVAKTDMPGTMRGQYVWIVECDNAIGDETCGHRYGVNSSEFARRLCPVCQGGEPSLQVEGHWEEQRT